MFGKWLWEKLRPPTQDIKTVGSFLAEKLRPPIEDVAKIGRALPPTRTPFEAAGSIGKFLAERTKTGLEKTFGESQRIMQKRLSGQRLTKEEEEKMMAPAFGFVGGGMRNVAKEALDKAGSQMIKQMSKKMIKPITKTNDVHNIQELKNSISEGKNILSTGRNNGRKLSKEELRMVAHSVENTQKKIGQEVKDGYKIQELSSDELFGKTGGFRKEEMTKEGLRKWNVLVKQGKAEIRNGKYYKVKPVEKLRAPKIPVEKITKEVTETPAQKLMTALKEAKPIRKTQEIIYTKERGEKLAKAMGIAKKTTGEKGFYSELGALKGKMTKAQFENIRNKIGQTDIDDLFNQVKDSPKLSEWDKIPARKGLSKILGEEGGVVPTRNELKLLKEVFGDDFVKTVSEKRSLFAKMKEAGIQLANIPRSIMASFDLSAPLRQGLFFVGKPKKFFSAFKSQFKVLGSEKAFKELNTEIASRPTYGLMKQNKLALTDLGNLSNREEAFLSNWAEKIPLVGKGVRASSRAYTGFLNKLRADVFDDFIKQGERLGIDDPKFLEDAANFVNTATGRGGLGQLEKASVELSTVFFSPRLTMSRINLINPIYYIKLHPAVRKEALKSLVSLAGIAMTIGGLAKMGGANVGTDPRNADFMKLKFGNTRYDILGGFQQPIRAISQIISGKIISSTTGKIITLGEGYKPLTRVDIAQRFLEYKLSPVISFAYELMKGQTAIGEKIDIPTETANRFIPMVTQDMYDLYKEDGAKGVAMGIPSIFGVGVQTYGGVQSYGLNGRDYPKLNAELNRLKTSMGFPSTSAFGQELSNKEYKELKEKTGKVIAEILTEVIADPDYQALSDYDKQRTIERIVDRTKSKIKEKTFPDKELISKLKKRIMEKGVPEEEAKNIAKDIYQKEFGK